MTQAQTLAVLGLGTFGTALARELARMGNRVVGLDLDDGRIQALHGDIDVVIQADATDIKVLDHAGLGSMDAAIVAIGDDMQASLLAAMAVQKTGVPRVMVKAQTPEHAQILRAMGVANILEPELAYAARTAQLLNNPKLSDFLNLGNGNYVAAMRAPVAPECKAVGDMKLERFELACVGIDIGERILTRDLDAHPLAPSDTLLLAGKREALRRFATQG